MKKFLGALLAFTAVFAFHGASASAAQRHWDGGGAGNNFADATNWDGDTPLADNDDITIDAAVTGPINVTNDTGLTFNTVTLITDTTTIAGVTVAGNELKISTALTSTFGLSGSGQQVTNVINANVRAMGSVLLITTDGTDNGRLVITGQLIGTGTISKLGPAILELLGTSSSLLGGFEAHGGVLKLGLSPTNQSVILGTGSAGTTLDGATLQICGIGGQSGDSRTLNENFSFLSATTITFDKINYSYCDTAYSIFYNEMIFADAFDYGSHPVTVIGSNSWNKLKLTGAVTGTEILTLQGKHTVIDLSDSTNNTTMPSGLIEPTAVSTTVGPSGTLANSLVDYNETLIYNKTSGSVDNITVGNHGVLKGTGNKIGVLSILAGGTLAPGQSPGCLTAGNTTIAGNFDVELGGTTACTDYDQLTVIGSVDVGGGTLNLSRYNDFKPALNDTFTILDNDSNDLITGTFSGLLDGATISLNGYTFTISYTGGDGNDIVLTVTGVAPGAPTTAGQTTSTAATPTTPNTGLALFKANPLITLIGTMLSASALFVGARKYGQFSN